MRFVWLLVIGLLFAGDAVSGGEGGGPVGKLILSEGSVWRAHITWMRAVEWNGTNVVDSGLRGGLAVNSAPPPANWTAGDFDDSAWMLWRETYPVSNLKLKDGTDTGVRAYEYRQYGIQMSPEIGLRCMRGRFIVDDPAGAKDLSLSLAYRGGVIAYLNGKEIGRSHVAKGGNDTPADAYPDDIYFVSEGKPWRLNIESPLPVDAESLKKFNERIRECKFNIDPKDIKKGVNVLAVEIRRAPYSTKCRAVDRAMHWSTCGLVTAELRGNGAIQPASGGSKGLQVWSANPLARVGPLGSAYCGRIGQGIGVVMHSYPISWGEAGIKAAPIRIVGARNGVFVGQVVVSSDAPIRGLKAVVGTIAQKGGAGKIPASDVQALYMGYPDEAPKDLKSQGISMLDILYENAPREIPARVAKPPVHFIPGRGAGTAWNDGGAVAPVWVKVKIAKDAVAGEYEGNVTVSADGLPPTEVAVRLRVHEYVLPEPRDYFTHVGLVHSPDTLAGTYKVTPWSDQHFALIEKTLAYMGALGGDACFVPLSCGVWPGGQQTMVRWIRDGNGYKYDFALFDRYMDLVQKHLKPEVVCLNVMNNRHETSGTSVTLLDPASGKVEAMPARPDKGGQVTPEDVAFWKPALDAVMERLKKRSLADKVVLGMLTECGRYDQKASSQFVDLFKQVLPEAKWADLAHYAASKPDYNGVKFGYGMAVWGNTTPFKSKSGFGCADLPVLIVKHFRADPVIDLRPTAHRGALLMAPDAAMGATRGIGPVGMDFWNFNAGEPDPRSRAGSMETAVGNLRMSDFGTAALLGPGTDGPVTTARYHIFQLGLQYCEAKAAIEKVINDANLKTRLPADFAKCYDEFNKENNQANLLMVAGERFAQGEGWKWYEASNWEDRLGTLFALAGEAAKVVKQ